MNAGWYFRAVSGANVVSQVAPMRWPHWNSRPGKCFRWCSAHLPADHQPFFCEDEAFILRVPASDFVAATRHSAVLADFAIAV